VPVRVIPKEAFIDTIMRSHYTMSFTLRVAAVGTVLAPLLSIALLAAANTAPRLTELAIMRALGYTDRRITATTTLTALYASRLSQLHMDAFGYVPPSKPLLSLAQAAASIPLAAAAVAAALLLLLRRAETSAYSHDSLRLGDTAPRHR